MPASQSGPSARLSSTQLTLFIPRPARQSRSRHTLYAVCCVPGGRGHAITNWQCTSQQVIYKIVHIDAQWYLGPLTYIDNVLG